MAPNPRVVAAYRAMTTLGINEVKVKPVLKQLLKLYDKNWEMIEQENYRVLADAIFEQDEKELDGKKQTKQNNDGQDVENEDAHMQDEPVRPLKRLRLGGTSSAAMPSKMPNVEDRPSPVQDNAVDKGKQHVSGQVALGGRKRNGSGRASPSVSSKEPAAEQRMVVSQKNQLPDSYALIMPKDEPIDEVVDYDAPLAAIPPVPGGRDPSMQLGSNRKQDSNGLSSAERRYRGRGEGIHIASDEAASHEVVAKQKCSAIEIASSTSGEVKITMSCSSALGRSDFRLPSRDQLLKKMEDKCLQSYNITDPNFSIMKLLRDMCDCMLEFRTDSNDDSQEGSEMIPSLNVMKESKTRDALINRGDTDDLGVHAGTSNGSTNVDPSALNAPHILVAAPLMTSMNNAVLVTNKARSDFPGCDDGKGLEDPISSHSGSLVVVQPHQLTPDDLRSLHGTEDLSKGEENVKIPWVNDITNDLPPPFHYLHQSIAFRDAYVNWCLSKIKCEDYCSTCFGDCLQSTTPCVCANNVEGGYAYTIEGLLKEKFLEECINISRNPERHQFYCQVCPLERAKNDDCIEPCKGHLKRKFIKECWVKCGCVKRCGNRVVQRGITSNLQVFYTSDGKGWGLRTKEELPKGAFVCEFVGEILTIKELHERNSKCARNGTPTHPVLLDADWDLGAINDKEALCLDAASYGNIARFINHRCLDANLIEIPVEVETSDHRYFHLAFFTSRKVAPLEELTWDYGIDFDDNEGPVKLFSCKCGSKFCRKMERSNRSIRASPVA